MKAYKVKDKSSIYSAVVFAESPSKAKSYAINNYIDEVEGSRYIDLRARRKKQLDKYYKLRKSLDWYIDEDRLALVKDGGYSCEEPSFECDNCIARKYCDTLKNDN